MTHSVSSLPPSRGRDGDKLRCLRFAEWPALDREAWRANGTPGEPLDDPRPADGLSPVSLQKYQDGYSRWLTFLASRGALDPAMMPAGRVTRRLVWAYLRELHGRGNMPMTIIGRIAELHMALRILAPDVDMSWVKRPRGRTVYTMLVKRRRTLLVPDAFVLAQWARDVMAAAEKDLGEPRNQVAFRDGLLLGILASRARRIRSLTGLRVDHDLTFRNGCFEVDLEEDQVKTGRADWFPLPMHLTQPMRLYLDVVRPALLGHQRGNRLWISIKGTPLVQGSIQVMIQRRSKARFGIGFGPHRFRHAVATTAALRGSDQPHLAAGMLNISDDVERKHYNRARQIRSSLNHDALLEQRMRELGINQALPRPRGDGR